MDAALLPIDIHSHKLTEWLVTRRVCQRQWLKDVAEARRRLQQLAGTDVMEKQGVDLELQAALQQPHVNYWHCEQIAEALKKIEASNKSVLFGYSSTVIRELDAILKVFRRGSCYLADAGRLLNKAAQEDAPYLKRQLERQRRRQAECERKRGEHAAAGAEARAKFLSLCKQLGLTQQPDIRRVREELVEQAEKLPEWYDTECARRLRQLDAALQVYDSFVRHAAGEDSVEEVDKEPLCPTLRLVARSGNCTRFQALRGRAPLRVEPYRLQLPSDDGLLLPPPPPPPATATDATDATDGEGDGEAAEDAAIDWDAGDAADGIDFGIEEVGIDFGIKEAGSDAIGGDAGDDDDGDTASGEMARGLLDCRDLREQLLDDLHELAAFLGRLGAERQDHANSVAQSLLAACPQTVLSADCRRLEAEARAAIAELTDAGRQHVVLIRSSPAYLGRLLRRFASLQELAAKAAAAGRLCDQRQTEAAEEEQSLLRQLASLRSQVADVKRRLEAELSRRHDNRRVNIMGEINAI